MYKVEKRFTLPIGHRLSKNADRCHSIHGHNITVLVGVKSEKLNSQDMVIDFYDLKKIVTDILDTFDHCLLLNRVDADISNQLKNMGMRTMLLENDPTAEKLSELLYNQITMALALKNLKISMDYVTVYENENSKATYSE